MKNFIRLNKIDNVVTVTKNIKEGFQIENFITKDEIPISHKVSSSKIKKGEAIKKYSQISVMHQETLKKANIYILTMLNLEIQKMTIN